MQFGLVNNYSTRLAKDLGDSEWDQAIYVEDASDDLVERISQGFEVTLTLFKTDENGKEIQREIVLAQQASTSFNEFNGGYFISVRRAQEGTERTEFSAGDGLEARLTAGSLKLLGVNNAIAIGSVSGGPNGGYSYVAIGNNVGAPSGSVVSIGPGTSGRNTYDVVVGSEAKTTPSAGLPPSPASTPSNIAIGRHALAGGRAALTVGADATAKGYLSAAVGHGAVAFGKLAQAFGGQSYAYGEGSTGIGFGAVALAENSIALGAGAVATLPFGRKSTTMPYLSLEGFPTPDPLIKGYRLPNDITYRQSMAAAILGVSDTPQDLTNIPDEVSAALDTAGQISEQVVLGSSLIDLTDANSTAAILLPERAMLFVESFDVVIMEADGPGGTPEVQISPYPGTPNTYLSNAAVTKQSVGGRNIFAPENEDGAQMLFISLAAAGTGALKAKVVVRGYIMEMGPLDQSGLGSHENLNRTLPPRTDTRWGWPDGNSGGGSMA